VIWKGTVRDRAVICLADYLHAAAMYDTLRRHVLGGALGVFVATLGFSGLAAAAPGDTVADRVLGHPQFAQTTCNEGGLGPRSLCQPAGLVVDHSGRLYVADTANNRVLSWPKAASFLNGQPSDLVIGQAGFFSSKCNDGGASVTTLCGPVGLAVAQNNDLAVADTNNNRVLWYLDPAHTDTKADVVLGQGASFATTTCNTGGVSNRSLCQPTGLAMDSASNLYVADWNHHRTLRYLKPVTTDTIAHQVFGQGGSFTTNTCNKNGLTAQSLCHPWDVAVDPGDSVYVSDSSNSRVLWYQSPPMLGVVADRVIGQAGSFVSNACNLAGVNARSLCLPRGLSVNGKNRLYVADAHNNRVLGYEAPPVSDTTADLVIGQGGSFQTNGCNQNGVNAAALCNPSDVAIDGVENVYGADTSNSRVLGYDAP
jgi:sugar lactone lactonase YvrE